MVNTHKPNLGSLADRVRNIPLEDILTNRGYNSRKEGVSTKFWNGEKTINVTGIKWHDKKSEMGGGGAIDLVMYLDKCDFKEACLSLSNIRPIESIPLTPPPQPSRKPFNEVFAQYATRDDSLWPIGRDYLINTRGLEPSMVDALYDNGKVWTNDHRPNPALVFPHFDEQGQIVGATLRDTMHQSSFRPSLGNKTGAFFVLGKPDASEIVAVESPIEALSYAELYGLKDRYIISCAGCHVPEKIIMEAVHNQKKLIVAFNNDEPRMVNGIEICPGHEGYMSACKVVLNLSPTAALPHRQIPISKDWNLDLLQGKKFKESFPKAQKKTGIKL